MDRKKRLSHNIVHILDAREQRKTRKKEEKFKRNPFRNIRKKTAQKLPRTPSPSSGREVDLLCGRRSNANEKLFSPFNCYEMTTRIAHRLRNALNHEREREMGKIPGEKALCSLAPKDAIMPMFSTQLAVSFICQVTSKSLTRETNEREKQSLIFAPINRSDDSPSIFHPASMSGLRRGLTTK